MTTGDKTTGARRAQRFQSTASSDAKGIGVKTSGANLTSLFLWGPLLPGPVERIKAYLPFVRPFCRQAKPAAAGLESKTGRCRKGCR